MKSITGIRLSNFKKFSDFRVKFNEDTNVFIGDNEAGKSSILLAIDLVLSGSKSKVETIGLETLLNIDCVNKFLQSPVKDINNLPKMYVELYLNEQGNHQLNGKNNSLKIICDGVRLSCEPIEEYGGEIKNILSQSHPNFPYEYYSIKFLTFADVAYTGYRRFLKHIVIDSSQINNEYATREYTKSIYGANADAQEKNKFQNEYLILRQELQGTKKTYP
jgi:putative ATP-dependent endonuclease of the OLD family